MKRWSMLALAGAFLLAGALSTPPAQAAGPLRKVTIAWSSGLQFFPIYVAQAEGYFADEGLELDTVTLASGPAQTAAMLAGSLDIDGTSFLQIVKSQVAGGDIRAFAMVFGGFPINIVLTNEAIAKAGITPGMSIDEKVKRLKGFTIGISGPGASTDTFARSLFLARGIDPNTYIKLTTIGDGPATWAAFQKHLIDGFSNTAPWVQLAESANLGKAVIDPTTGEVPELADVPYEVLATSKQVMAEKPELIVAFTRAIARAEKLVQDHPEEARKIKQYFPNVSDQAMDLAIEQSRRGSPAVPDITQAHLTNTLKWMNIGAKDPVKVDYAQVVDPSPAQKAAGK